MHSQFLCFFPVVKEEEGSGEEEHPPKDDNEGAEHEGVA